MKRIGIIGLCFAAVLAFSVVAVASASATEVLFNVASGSFKASGGEAVLHGASEVKCTSSNATGTISDAHLGTTEIKFVGCTTQLLGSHTCTSTGAATGEIVTKGGFHLGLARHASTETAHPGILILVTPLEFTCSGVGTVKVSGEIAGLLFNHANTGPLLISETLQGAHLVFKSSGTKQEDKEFILSLAAGAVMTVELKCEIFGITGECAENASGEFKEVEPPTAHLVEE